MSCASLLESQPLPPPLLLNRDVERLTLQLQPPQDGCKGPPHIYQVNLVNLFSFVHRIRIEDGMIPLSGPAQAGDAAIPKAKDLSS